jgi:hypothetical protein
MGSSPLDDEFAPPHTLSCWDGEFLEPAEPVEVP